MSGNNLYLDPEAGEDIAEGYERSRGLLDQWREDPVAERELWQRELGAFGGSAGEGGSGLPAAFAADGESFNELVDGAKEVFGYHAEMVRASTVVYRGTDEDGAAGLRDRGQL